MRSTGLVNWHVTDLSHSYIAAGYARHRLPPSEIARARRTREQRSVPFAAAANALEDGAQPALDPDRFLAAPGNDPAGHWRSFPLAWEHEPESRLEAAETLDVVRRPGSVRTTWWHSPTPSESS